jgi:hypothetical protein
MSDQHEYHRILDRQTQIKRMIPVPQCCLASRKHPAVIFTVAYDEGDSHKAPGYWTINVFDKLVQAINPNWAKGPLPRPKYCPYCGKALPQMRRKNPIPPTVCRVVDGGFYCSTCRNRLQACLCDPLSFAFEPVLRLVPPPPKESA